MSRGANDERQTALGRRRDGLVAMSRDTLIRRWLKVADPSAITARETLQRSLAYGRDVAAVDRSEVFAISWKEEVPDPRGSLQRLLRESKHALGNDIGHDFVGSTGDSQARHTHVGVLKQGGEHVVIVAVANDTFLL